MPNVGAWASWIALACALVVIGRPTQRGHVPASGGAALVTESSGVELSGEIVDGADAAVGGAAVRIAPDERHVGLEYQATADAEGRFTVRVPPGRYRLAITGADVHPSEVRAVEVPGDALRLIVARLGTITGTVTDRGTGVEATVELIDGETGERQLTRSTASGQFVFTQVPDHPHRVRAYAGELTASAQTVADTRTPIALALVLGTIAVVRVKAATGAPVQARVELAPTIGDEPARYLDTNADGVARFEGVPHGRYDADAYAAGHVSEGAVEFIAGHATPTLRQSAGARLTGRVVTAQGAPVVGAELWLEYNGGRTASAFSMSEAVRRFRGELLPPDVAPSDLAEGQEFIPRGELGVVRGPIPFPPLTSPIAGATTRRAVALTAAPARDADQNVWQMWQTGADGTFVLTGLPAGEATVFARHSRYPEARSDMVRLVLGQAVNDLILRVEAGGELVGRITAPDGSAISGARVVATTGARAVEARSGADGAFVVTPLAGEYQVTVSAFGFGRHLFAVSVDGAATVERDIVLPRADAELRGDVVDPTGLPLVGAEVRILSGPESGRRARSEQSGFVLAALPPGEYAAVVSHRDLLSANVTLRTDQANHVALQWGGGIQGHVLNRLTGEALGGVAVIVRPTAPRRPTERVAPTSVSTDDTGAFVLRTLAPGAYEVSVEASGFTAVAQTVDVAAGAELGAVTARGLRFELVPGALVGGIVRDQWGLRVAGARVTARVGDVEVATTTDAHGQFRLRECPAGRVELTAHSSALRGRTSLTVAPGDERLEIFIDLR